jgi:hypothetical protein
MPESTPAHELRTAAARVREASCRAGEMSALAAEVFALLLEQMADGWPTSVAYTSTTRAAHVRKQALAFARQINTKREGK